MHFWDTYLTYLEGPQPMLERNSQNFMLLGQIILFGLTRRDESRGWYESSSEDQTIGNRVLINTDGAVQLDSENVATRGVVRDENED